MHGHIRLHRKMLEWEWFTTPHMAKFFIYLLLKANWKDCNYKGVRLKRGQLMFGRKKAAEVTGISEQSIRTCVRKLKSTSEITIKSTNKYSIITVCNYDLYQVPAEQANQQINQQPNQQSTSNQPQLNKYKKDKKIRKDMGAYTPAFEDFWKKYPRKVKKQDAFKVWERDQLENGPFDSIMSGLATAVISRDWAEEGGKYVPHPTTWLNQKRWTDELEPAASNDEPNYQWRLDSDGKPYKAGLQN